MKGLNVKWLAVAILAVLIVYGLGAGLMYSLNFELSSDTVVPGVVAKEVFSNGNFQFEFPVNDPYLFTDIYTFHLLPQVLSGYDPTVLRLTAFAMFLILIAIFSYHRLPVCGHGQRADVRGPDGQPQPRRIYVFHQPRMARGNADRYGSLHDPA